MRFFVFVLSVGHLLTACGSTPAEGCLVNDDCDPGQSCVNGECVIDDMSDAGVFDAETCGMPCDTGNPCAVGAYDCASGAPICVGVGPAAPDVVCREADGACDVEETCDGESTECPDDARSPAGTECRAAAGECDVAEVCDGESAACPPDGFAPTAAVCEGGFCDGFGACSTECVTGAPCQPANLCRTGELDCLSDPPTCTPLGDVADGTTCGPSSELGDRPACTFDSDCDQSGTQLVTVTDRLCMAGTCESVTREDPRPCSRVTENQPCAGGARGECARCTRGSCEPFISCAPGLTCCELTMCRTDCRDIRE